MPTGPYRDFWGDILAESAVPKWCSYLNQVLRNRPVRSVASEAVAPCPRGHKNCCARAGHAQRKSGARTKGAWRPEHPDLCRSGSSGFGRGRRIGHPPHRHRCRPGAAHTDQRLGQRPASSRHPAARPRLSGWRTPERRCRASVEMDICKWGSEPPPPRSSMRLTAQSCHAGTEAGKDCRRLSDLDREGLGGVLFHRHTEITSDPRLPADTCSNEELPLSVQNLQDWLARFRVLH